MKILLKLVLRIEKQLKDEQVYLAEFQKIKKTPVTQSITDSHPDFAEERRESPRVSMVQNQPEKLGTMDSLNINQEILNELVELEKNCISFFDEQFEGEDKKQSGKTCILTKNTQAEFAVSEINVLDRARTNASEVLQNQKMNEEEKELFNDLATPQFIDSRVEVEEPTSSARIV